MFGESASRRQRALLVAGVIFIAGLGTLFAFASHPARAILTDMTTTPSSAATTVSPTPDPAPTPEPAPKPTPKPTYIPPAVTPAPPVRAPAAPVGGSAKSTPKSQKVSQRHRRTHAKKNTLGSLVAATTKAVPPAAVTTRVALPAAAAKAVASAPAERTALASPAAVSSVAEILLLAGFALGALLVGVAMLVPASAPRFTFPGGRVVIEHHVDLAILGIALAVLTGLVYALEMAGQ